MCLYFDYINFLKTYISHPIEILTHCGCSCDKISEGMPKNSLNQETQKRKHMKLESWTST